jgi:hypothetical protein
VSSVDFTGQAAVHAQDLAGVIGTTQDPVVSAGADLDAYARAWDLPAAVRAVHAHSSGVNSAFPGKYNELVLEQYVGTPMYRWHHDVAAGTYAPGIKGQGEYADFWLHRSLWQARPTVTSASFLVHYGCDTPNSDGTSVHPYTHPLFAPCRLASCLVFYTDVLLMIGRTKVYMDAPVSFLQPLHGGSTAGEAWLRLYDEAANNAQLADFPHWADAKIAYSWALLGDWTLRRRY